MQNTQPSAIRSVIWWLGYTVCGVWAMYLLPGVDFFIPGLLCSMQEGNRQQSALLVVFFVLIQEGVSLFSFGPAVMWYAVICLLFYLGRCLFEADNVVYVFLLSVAFGAWQVVVGITMQHLQDVAILLPRLIVSGCLNALIIPPVWFVVYRLRERELCHVNPS